MKKLTFYFILLTALVSLNSCTEDDPFTFTAKPDPQGLTFTNTAANMYNLNSSDGDALAERFVWNPVDFGVQTPITYKLEGSATEDFTATDVFDAGNNTNVGVTVAQMLSLAHDAGLDNDPETEEPNSGTLYFRVRAYVGSDGGNVVDQTSEVMELNVTIPEAEVEAPMKNFFLVGDATAAGWSNNANNTPLFRDVENTNIFYFQGRFAGGDGVEGFKLLENLGQWQPQWGGTDGVLAVNPGDGSDPAAFSVPTDGYYDLMINIEDMTYTFTEIDASAAATYDVIGLVGEGTTVGWPNDDNPEPDIKLVKSNFDPHIWYSEEDVNLSDGPIKFRANLAWDTNWGGDTFPTGKGVMGGSDIAAETGTYTVWFNDLSGRYQFIPTQE